MVCRAGDKLREREYLTKLSLPKVAHIQPVVYEHEARSTTLFILAPFPFLNCGILFPASLKRQWFRIQPWPKGEPVSTGQHSEHSLLFL